MPYQNSLRNLLLIFAAVILSWTCAGLVVCSKSIAAEPPYDTPQAAAADKDFAIQGEYTAPKLGMQVIAMGEGDFEIVLYQGGLPGDGWDRTAPQRTEGDAGTVKELAKSRGLSKVERKSPTLGSTPPAAAIVLFDGTQESLDKHWRPGAKRTDDGLLMQGATSLDTFQDYTLHIEFRGAFQPKDRGQGRGNSGVYHQGRYETQVLDSFGLEGKDNETGGIYTVRDPDINMCFPPLNWQTYDVDFTAARFDGDGKKLRDAMLTVKLNGVIVQRDVKVPHTTTAAPEMESAAPGPIYLQDHGNPVRYRNVWVVPRNAEQDARRPRVSAFERFHAAQTVAPESSHLGGRLLISQLGCSACHTSDEGTLASLHSRPAPLLDQVGSRLRPDHLLQFISRPHDVKPGTAMPDLFHGLNDADRKQQSEAIASYLLASARLIDRSGDSAAAARGEVAFHTIGCAACHAPRRGEANLETTSVPLGDLTAKYTLDALSRFLADPHAVRPSGLMPKLVSDLSEARDIACFLLGPAIIVPGAEQFAANVYFGSWEKLPDFEKLQPDKTGTTSGLDLSVAGRNSDFAATFEAYLPVPVLGEYRFFLSSDDGSRVKLDGRSVVEFDGIHPASVREGTTRLEAGVHSLRVEYFEKGGEEILTLEVSGPDFGKTPIAGLITADPKGAINAELLPSVFKPQAELVTMGQKLFQSIGCATCHKPSATDSTAIAHKAKPLKQLRPNAGCLAEQPPVGLPHYDLTSNQRDAIHAALKSLDDLPSATADLEFQLAHNNCVACHERGDSGGPEATREALFLTRMQEMGNEGRLPPTLTGVGDKLQAQYLVQTIANGAKERPYMLTRMPGFGAATAQSLSKAFVALDTESSSPTVPNEHASQATEQTIASGRKLVGSEGLACIKCHTFGAKATPGIQAIDMKRMSQRLRADWFERYMREPTRYRPGTRMPLSFPDGKSTLTTVFDGDPHQQIDAMWNYLLQGDKAREPVGLDAESIVLKPIDRPIIYRNFIEGLGPRGIAVGFPEQTNYAWDAGNMSLAMIWKNGFIDASKHWVGRGPGNQVPLGDFVVHLESSAPLAVLAALDAAWPTESARGRGYRFKGYQLNSSGQPSFRYEFANATVEDQPLPAVARDQQSSAGLSRRLNIHIEPSTENLVFRAAAGEIVVSDQGYLLNDQVRIVIEGAKVQLVEIAGQRELRARLPDSGDVTITETLTW